MLAKGLKESTEAQKSIFINLFQLMIGQNQERYASMKPNLVYDRF